MGNLRDLSLAFFGDDISHIYPTLQALQRRKSHSVLVSSFLENSYIVYRDELGNLPRPSLGQVPRFTSIYDLVEGLQSQPSDEHKLIGPLICVAQLAACISYFEERPEAYLDTNSTCVLGRGYGLLSAAAIASCGSLANLTAIAVEVVRIALRTALHVQSISERLGGDFSDGPWAVAVSNATEIEVRKELDAFYKTHETPKVSQAYISGVDINSVTISGVPFNLEKIVSECVYFAQRTTVPLDSPGLYHNPLTYDTDAVHDILNPSLLRIHLDSPSTFHMLSSSTGESLKTLNRHLLFERVVHELLTSSSHWDKVLESIVAKFDRSPQQPISILSFGSSPASSSLISIFHEKHGVEVRPEDLFAWTLNADTANAVPKSATSGRIAIIGMAIKAPGADDCEEMWRILEHGLDMHQTIPKDRFDIETHVDPTGKRKNTSHTPYGCFIEKPGNFDARFFGMSPAEAAQTDPMHRLALITAYEALEMSGFVPNRTPSTKLSRVGTFYGQTSDDWREINAAQNIGTYLIPGGVRAFAPGRINYWFKFGGPSYSIDTACSSSLAAVQVACTSLLQNECDMAVSGGLNILTNPDIFAGLSRGGFLSKTGPCKVFDEAADGYCRADGCGTVVLKRLEDAEADNDNILGVILGTATNHSPDAISITHPHAGAQAQLYQSVLNGAGVDPLEVSVVEMHGTGTQAGDLNEMRSVTQILAPESRHREIPLHLSGVKANLGHSEAAAGITGLIKLLMMLQKNSIPPHIGIKTSMNPKLPQDLSARNVHIPQAALEWKSERLRLAFLNNFSAAGGNTSLLLEEAQRKPTPENRDTRSSHVVAVSAKSIASLKRNTERLISYVKNGIGVEQLSDLAYTSCARRLHHNYRLAVPVTNTHEIEEKLTLAIAGDLAPVPRDPPKVVIVFTGQGSFYLGIGKKLFETSSVFRGALLEMNKISVQQASIAYLPLITGEIEPGCDVESPAVTQVAQLCVQMALVILWRSWGVVPDAVLGHSLGEYAALYAAGVLSMSDAIYLVAQRALLIQKHCTAGTHGLLVVQSTMASIEAASCGIPYEVACRNSDDAIVLAMPIDGIKQLNVALTNTGIRSIILNCPYGFHSSQCDPILDSYQEIARGVNIRSPQIPVISSVLGRTVTRPGIIDAAYISHHTRATVNFVDALRSAEEEQVIDAKSAFIELGPHPTCCRMIQSTIVGASPLYTLHKSEDVWLSMSKTLASLHNAGLTINWGGVHQDFESSQRLLHLPRFSFDEKNYWIDYTGDWCLTKGEIQALPPLSTTELLPTEPIPLWQRKSNLSTTTVHCIVEEQVDATSASAKFQTDLSEPVLNSAITGHLVNGVALCPSSIFADIALTIGNYLNNHLKLGDPNSGMDVCHMEVSKPLIARKDSTTSQILQVSATTILNSQQVELSYASLDSDGREAEQHARCVVQYKDSSSWIQEWSAIQFLVQERIDELGRAEANELISKITKGLAYKLFATFVDYQPKYRGMDLVIMDPAKLEATAKVTFQTNEGQFFCSPYWIDSLAHLSGFILNGGDAAESGKFVFISHGWKSMRFSRQFTYGETYQTYVRMLPGPKNIYEGNVYIFDKTGEDIVGVVGGLKFQRIPMTLLHRVLPAPAMDQTAAAQTTPQRRVTAVKDSIQRSDPDNEVRSMVTKPTAPFPLVTQSIPIFIEPKRLPQSPSLVSQVLDVVSDSLGVELIELRDETYFGDIGLDSLMALEILSQLREILGFEVPGALFIDQPTVKDLRVYLTQVSGTMSPPYDGRSDLSSSPASVCSMQMSSSTATSVDINLEDRDVEPHGTDISGLISTIRNIISEQMDVSIAEITDSTDLPSLGLDSLMSLSILGSLREETGQDWPSDLFITNPTIEDIEQSLKQNYESPKLGRHKQPELYPFDTGKIQAIDPTNYPRAKAFMLQGHKARAKQTLFLFPDGSGSASSYAKIPPIGEDLVVYGFNCPFMTTPDQWTIGIDGVATLYLAELRRLQPTGPYLLGGWSAGGVIAYEVMQQLLRSGERVERLILLDAPNPLDIVRLPPRLHHFFGDIGLLGDLAPESSTGVMPKKTRNIPSWLLPHFESCINALVAYKPLPIVDQAHLPKVHAIWARYGVCRFPHDPRPDFPIDDPPHLKWLLENRTDFGTNGWDRLIPGGEIQTEVLDGNHFTIMNDHLAHELAMAIHRGTEW